MSSEWWSVLVVFWGLYLADGLRCGRRTRWYFHHWRASRHPAAGAAAAAWFCTPPAPSAWMIPSDDLPASLAPEGFTNWPSGSASRPPPFPDSVIAFRWEDVRTVEERHGWIIVNAHRFAPVSAGFGATSFDSLVRELAPLSPALRADRLRRWQSARFASARLSRRLRATLLRTRSIAFLNTLQATVLAGLSAYLLLNGPALLPPAARDAVASALPALLLGCTGLHVIAVVWFYRLHRRLSPKAGSERAGLLFTALFVPPQALRFRLHLIAKFGAGLHPLAVAFAVARPTIARELAVATLRDLRWPRLPDTLPPHITALVRSSSALLEPVVVAALARQVSLPSADVLLAAPARTSADTCAYCPRCGDEFTRPDSRCPHGIPLCRF